MKLIFEDFFTSIILVTIVFVFFIVFAIIRISNSWKSLKYGGKLMARKIIDLSFSSIFLIASIIFFSVFIINIGK